jgi:hypothetical protein
MIDSSRNKIDIALFCSKHPNTKLRISHDKSRVGADSAYEVNLKMSVHPCDDCQHELNEIKYAVRVIQAIQMPEHDKEEA